MTNLLTQIKEEIKATKSGDLLGIDTNIKTVKGQKLGYKTAIMYLAPATNIQAIKGYEKFNLCPMSVKAQCQAPCLFTAGLASVYSSVNEARLRRTHFFVKNEKAFLARLVIEIARFVNKQIKENNDLYAVRLNGTSDVVWEMKNVTIDKSIVDYVKRYYKNIDLVEGEYNNIFEIFPNVQFYDYTKLAGRLIRNIPTNYDLTFSYSGVESYQKQVNMALKTDTRIAVVFRNKKSIPTTFMGKMVVDGDSTDLRFLDPKNTIVALVAKGKAKSDQSGFVVDVTN